MAVGSAQLSTPTQKKILSKSPRKTLARSRARTSSRSRIERNRSSGVSFLSEKEGQEVEGYCGYREWIGYLFIDSDIFQTFVALVILANAAIIGFETDLPELDGWWSIFEDAFFCFFLVEICLRLSYWREEFFYGTDMIGNVFDLCIVALGAVDFLLTKLLQANLGQFGTFLQALRMLRILRLFRLFKMIKPLYMLASGFVGSFAAVFWVSVLGGLALYISSIFLVRTIGDDAEECGTHGKDYCARHFKSVGRAMFSLFQIMANPALDDVKDIMLDNPALMFFFILFVIYGSFAMLSILTGVISEGMVQQGSEHREQYRFEQERKKEIFLERLRCHFEESDTNGDGTMTREEFSENLPQMIQMFREEGFLSYSEDDLEMVFDLVDFDKGGTIEVEEFLQGMISFVANVSDLPMRVLHLQSNFFLHMRCLQDRFEERFDDIDLTLSSLDEKVNSISLKAPPVAPQSGLWFLST